MYYSLQGMFTHDPSVIAYLVDPTLFTMRKAPIRVETQGISRGKTWPAFGPRLLPPWKDRPLVNIAVEVDAERTLDLILNRL